MIGLPALIAAMAPAGDDGWSIVIPDNWMQGRTSYGGLSAALAVHAARMLAPDLPPLRSAQVAFVGPLAGEVTVRARLLRRGRNAAFVRAEVSGAAGLGLSATFVFMQALASAIVHEVRPAPVPPPCPADTVSGGLAEVAFTQNFAFVDRPDGARGAAAWCRWVRLNDREGLSPDVELMAVGDCLPPAALRLADGRVPLSSMTWQVDMLSPSPVSSGGWWLLEAATDHVRDGGSSQRMAIRDAAGAPVAAQMQSVALFG